MWNYYTHTKKVFQLKGTVTTNLSPSNISEYSFLSKLSDTFVNPWKVLCSPITPYLFIVEQYFFSSKTIHNRYHRLRNHSYLVTVLYQLIQFYLI